MIQLKDMELDDEDKLDTAMPIPTNRPDYPWGLKICITEKEFEKLGLDPSAAEVGGYVHGHFMGCITSVSSEQRDSGDTCRVEIQIEKLAIESEDEEDEES